MDRYQKQEKGGGDIGKGAYGVVYKGTDRQTGKTVAMKVCLWKLVHKTVLIFVARLVLDQLAPQH